MAAREVPPALLLLPDDDSSSSGYALSRSLQKDFTVNLSVALSLFNDAEREQTLLGAMPKQLFE